MQTMSDEEEEDHHDEDDIMMDGGEFLDHDPSAKEKSEVRKECGVLLVAACVKSVRNPTTGFRFQNDGILKK